MLSLQGQSALPTTHAKPRPAAVVGPLRKNPCARPARHQPHLAIGHRSQPADQDAGVLADRNQSGQRAVRPLSCDLLQGQRQLEVGLQAGQFGHRQLHD